MMVAQTKVVEVNMVRIRYIQDVFLDEEPMFSEGLDLQFEKRNNTTYRFESQSIISI